MSCSADCVYSQGAEIDEDTVLTVPLSRRLGPDDDTASTVARYTWDQTPPEFADQAKCTTPRPPCCVEMLTARRC